MKFVSLGVIALFAAAAAPASAVLVHDFQLNGSLSDAFGGPDIVNNGGTLGATGITFGANQGPTLGGFANTGVYSVALSFSHDVSNGYRKILDFKTRTSDNGLYNLNQNLNFYPITTSPTPNFADGVLASVVLTRDASGLTTGYVNGVQYIQFVDSNNLAVIDTELNFLRDDFATGEREAAAGFLDSICVYDTALTGAEVAAQTCSGSGVGAVPEPATWALMIAGFGFVGTALRRRTALTA